MECQWHNPQLKQHPDGHETLQIETVSQLLFDQMRELTCQELRKVDQCRVLMEMLVRYTSNDNVLHAMLLISILCMLRVSFHAS